MPGSLVFPRGSHVLEYWLAHAEGFTVRSRGSVERVIVEPLYGRATALVVRSGRFRRRQVVSAADVTSVDPEARVLELDAPAPRGPSRARARARSAQAWLAPRLGKALHEVWAATLIVLTAALRSGRSLYRRGVEWYAEHGAARAGGESEAARTRRPRGAVGRHLRP